MLYMLEMLYDDKAVTSPDITTYRCVRQMLCMLEMLSDDKAVPSAGRGGSKKHRWPLVESAV